MMICTLKFYAMWSWIMVMVLVGFTWLSKDMGLWLISALIDLMRFISNCLSLGMMYWTLIYVCWCYSLMVKLSWLFAQLCDMPVGLNNFVLFVWWCTRYWLNEDVLLIYMVFLNAHKDFQSKLPILMKCRFLAWFYDVCTYGLILITSGALHLFFPFSHILGFGRGMYLETTLKDDMEFSFIQAG